MKTLISSVAYGGLNSLASYNPFNANIMRLDNRLNRLRRNLLTIWLYFRDAILISLSNCLTSVFAGFVVFAFVGYLASISGQRIDKVIQAGKNKISAVFLLNFPSAHILEMCI